VIIPSHLSRHARKIPTRSKFHALHQGGQPPLRILTTSPRSASTNLIVARFTISATIANSSTTPGTTSTAATATTARTLGHKLSDETRDGSLANFRHRTWTPPPLPRYIVVLAAATSLLCRSARAATGALL
jgi:hypothetical protein